MVKIKMVKIANDIVLASWDVLTSSGDVVAPSVDVLAPSRDMVALVDVGRSAREEGSLMSLFLHQESLRIP